MLECTLKGAFGIVKRPLICSKLMSYIILNNMYNQAKSCVSANDTCSNYFSCSIELFTLCMLMTQSFYLKQSIIYKTLLIFMKNIVINKNSPPKQLKQR
ncbi:hypothetical protein MAR_034507, partial [Mya arenaria]